MRHTRPSIHRSTTGPVNVCRCAHWHAASPAPASTGVGKGTAGVSPWSSKFIAHCILTILRWKLDGARSVSMLSRARCTQGARVRRGSDEGSRVGVDAVAEREAAELWVRGEEGELQVRVPEEATREALERCSGLLEEEDRVCGGERGCLLTLEVDIRGDEPGVERPVSWQRGSPASRTKSVLTERREKKRERRCG